jgi:hypothetical protein
LKKNFIFACNFRRPGKSDGHYEADSARARRPHQQCNINQFRSERKTPMTKSTMKSLLMTAAMSGLLTGASTAVSASTTSTSNSGPSNLARALGHASASNFNDKHACKGQNSCKGTGGCKTGDNGCKGKNSCKGKGGCATDKLQAV